jgi:hypothetical protein
MMLWMALSLRHQSCKWAVARREAEPNRHFIEQKLGQALTRRRHAFRIEKPMQMHNKVAHFGVVDGSLRLCLQAA